MQQIRIIRTSHQNDLSEAGTVQRLVRVDFMIGQDGPFNVSFPEDEFSASAAQVKIEAIAKQLEILRASTSGS
jgi:hypothetical protein